MIVPLLKVRILLPLLFLLATFSSASPVRADDPTALEQWLISLTEQVLTNNPHYRCSTSSGEIPALKGTILALFGRHSAALKELLLAHSLDPKLPYTSYTTACLLALMGEDDQALNFLESAIRLDALYWKKARLDKDFQSLVENDRFQTLISEKFLSSIDYTKTEATHCDDNYVFSLNIVKDMFDEESSDKTKTSPLAAPKQQPRSFTESTPGEADQKHRLAGEESSYGKRLRKVLQKVALPSKSLNFRIYLDPAVNAFAYPDGSIRIYAGMMDVLEDDEELLGIIAHEIGHIELKHFKKQALASALTASWTSALIKRFTSQIFVVGDDAEPINVRRSEQDIQTTVRGRWSQALETEADEYAATFLKESSQKPLALAKALKALGHQLQSSINPQGNRLGEEDFYIESHLSSKERAEHIVDFINREERETSTRQGLRPRETPE